MKGFRNFAIFQNRKNQMIKKAGIFGILLGNKKVEKSKILINFLDKFGFLVLLVVFQENDFHNIFLLSNHNKMIKSSTLNFQ